MVTLLQVCVSRWTAQPVKKRTNRSEKSWTVVRRKTVQLSRNQVTHVIIILETSRNVWKRTFGDVRPAKIQISLRIRADWSESSLGAFWIAMDAKFLHADNEDSDQTAWNRTCQKVHFPRCGSYVHHFRNVYFSHTCRGFLTVSCSFVCLAILI